MEERRRLVDKLVAEVKEDFKESLVKVNFDYITVGDSEDYLASYYFEAPNVNKKFMNIVNRYKKILEWNILFSMCTEIALKTIGDFEVYNKDLKNTNTYQDVEKKMTTAIVFAMDKQINNHIDDWTGAYRSRAGGREVMYSPEPPTSLEVRAEWEFLYEERIKDKIELTPDELEIYGDTSIEGVKYLEVGDPKVQRRMDFYLTPEISPNKQLDYIKNVLYESMTERQAEVWNTLVENEGNQSETSRVLGCSQQNISNIQNNIIESVEGKLDNFYLNQRKNLIDKLEKFLDDIESEKDIINFIKDNLEEEFIYYILYDSELDPCLRRYFNQNKDKEKNTYTDTMRKFTTYFICELYKYIEILEDNLIYSNKVRALRPDEVEEKKEFIGSSKSGNIHKYIREDKATEEQKSDEYIVIDNEKYYLIEIVEAKDERKTKTEYIKGA